MSVIPTGVVIPPQLAEMVTTLMKGPFKTAQHLNSVKPIEEWILTNAQQEFGEIIQKRGAPTMPAVIDLYCKIAIQRAIIKWYRDTN